MKTTTKKALIVAAAAAVVGVGIGLFVHHKNKKEKNYVDIPKNEDPVADPETVIKDYDPEAAMPTSEPVKEQESEEEVPYQIEKEAFGEYSDYEVKTLTWYADGALTDERNVLMDDDNTAGDLQEFFKDEDTDVVYVRNDVLGYDFEIVRDPRRYVDIVKKNPHVMGGFYVDDSYEE